MKVLMKCFELLTLSRARNCLLISSIVRKINTLPLKNSSYLISGLNRYWLLLATEWSPFQNDKQKDFVLLPQLKKMNKKLKDEVGGIVVIGCSAAGKSALLQTYSSGGLDFPLKYKMTIGVETSTKVARTSSNDPVKLIFLDSGGFDLYYGTLLNYWYKPNMLLVVYDVTSQTSFTNVQQWIELARNIKWRNEPSLPAALALFANKTDLIGRRMIPFEKGKELADSYHMQYFEGSAKSNEGVVELFQWLATQWHKYCSEGIQRGNIL